MGAALLLAGIVAAIASAPIFDRVLTHHLGITVRILCPFIGVSWLSLIWAGKTTVLLFTHDLFLRTLFSQSKQHWPTLCHLYYHWDMFHIASTCRDRARRRADEERGRKFRSLMAFVRTVRSSQNLNLIHTYFCFRKWEFSVYRLYLE
jgi:hypothetical protein